MRGVLIVVAAGLLTACSSTRYIQIETYNPGEVTFPEHVGQVLIVNNAVPQPKDTGYTYELFGEAQDACETKADSALFVACRELGEAIADASYFNDILLYHDAIQKDRVMYKEAPLTQEQVVALCEETGADAVISLDRLLFDMEKSVSRLGGTYVIGTIEVQVAGIIRSYMPDREQPLATVHLRDSVYWAESADYLPLLEQILPTSEEALEAAGQYVGAKAYAHFVPHWVNESRWFFTAPGARWKEATAYASDERWDMAEERWLALYRSTKGWKGRAKAASNLALCHEMEGDLEEAHEWASKSYDLFKQHAGEEAESTKLQKLYMQVLSERIRSDAKLNMQFGEE